MKKYQRLLLFITTITSLTMFLVYRHHYNRLHHVLEVFNFFGQPCNFSELQNSNGVISEHDWGPLPLWQRIGTSGYVYSAYLVEKYKVQALAVSASADSPPNSCYLWFENEKIHFKGRFTVSEISERKSAGLVANSYFCSFKNKNNVPYAVSFRTKSDSNIIKIITNDALNRQISLNSTICILPSDYSKKLLLEFLSFHSILGIDSFIIYYDQDVPYRLTKLLKNLTKTLSLRISFLPWHNLPLLPKNLIKTIIENDCKLRTLNQSKYSVVLDTNEYIVPLPDDSSQNLTIWSIPVKRFCLNHRNENRPIVLQNFEVVDDYSYNEMKPVFKTSLLGNNDALNIFNRRCSVHRYVKCTHLEKTKIDFSIKRFSTDLTRSTLVQLLIHDNI